MKKLVILLSLFMGSLILAKLNDENPSKNLSKKTKISSKKKTMETKPVYKKILKNGLTILVRPMHSIPKVSLQLWYGVGSRDEQDKERGIAHLIEHMIFKGTKRLSESDINVITHILSGSTNAFTSYDFTGYLFNLPSQHWHEGLSIMADCMINCTFKEDMLDSEMKAVIQELKMYKDYYVRSLEDEMIGVIFADHPYHHPIIGYKQDLWSVRSEDLLKFYRKHYAPNNATLVVVGDVTPEEVFEQAQHDFGNIPAAPHYKREEFAFQHDIISKSVTLYRDVKQPTIVFSFVVPGLKEKQDHILSLIAWILGQGKGSRLYHKLVNEKHLVTSVSASAEELFDHGLFLIVCEPKSIEACEEIKGIIQQEIDDIVAHGVTPEELNRAIKLTQSNLYSIMEDTEHQAFEIGKFYLATGDENYLFHYLNQTPQVLQQTIRAVMDQYLRPSLMHIGKVLPIREQDKSLWLKFQKESDEMDERILSGRNRTTPVEPPMYAKQVEVKEPGLFHFPKPTIVTLDNGLKLFYYASSNTPKVDVVLDFKAKYYYDPVDMQGLYQFVSKMLMEGTQKYTAKQLIDLIESRGMTVQAYPGGIALNALAADLPFALELLNEILSNATFPEKEIEKVRAQLITKVHNFWDEPRYFGSQLLKEELYKNHPYSKNSYGSVDSIKKIKRDDLVSFYKKYISPQEARLAIVGDIEKFNIPQLVQEKLGSWQGPKVTAFEFPALTKPVRELEINYPINRDQILLNFATLSISRKDPNFDKLLLFDQIFGGGALGSMSSRLFELREQSGLFYTISGSLLSGTDEQPGMFSVRTIVSGDRLKEAEQAIKKTIKDSIDSITEDELAEAKRAVINSLVDNFASNANVAQAFLFEDRYKFPRDFFDKRAQDLNKVTLKEVKDAARAILINPLITLRVGRVEACNVPSQKEKNLSKK